MLHAKIHSVVYYMSEIHKGKFSNNWFKINYTETEDAKG